MERGKESGSSSLASDLFGAKHPSSKSSSSGIFSTIFPHPSTGASGGHQSLHKNSSANEAWNKNFKSGVSEKKSVTGEAQNRGSTFDLYPEDKIKPFHYSSSIYYGAQDVYFEPENSQKPGATPVQKDGGGEDLDGALRGNWWQGSLYY